MNKIGHEYHVLAHSPGGIGASGTPLCFSHSDARIPEDRDKCVQKNLFSLLVRIVQNKFLWFLLIEESPTCRSVSSKGCSLRLQWDGCTFDRTMAFTTVVARVGCASTVTNRILVRANFILTEFITRYIQSQEIPVKCTNQLQLFMQGTLLTTKYSVAAVLIGNSNYV